MTEKEIITALDCCYGFHCEKCPLKGDAHCGQTLKDESIRRIQSLQAEIDYWKQQTFNGCMEKENIYKVARAEAIKKFADKLKANRPRLNTGEQVFYIRPEEVDNLVKEMAGGSDAL